MDKSGFSQDFALSAKHYENIVNANADAVVVVDDRQIIRFINPAATDMFGYSEDELRGMPLVTLMPLRFRAQHPAFVRNFKISPEQGRFMNERMAALVGLRANGEEFYIDVSIAKSRLGTEIYYMAIVRDVTRQKRQEDDLLREMLRAEAASLAKSAFIANMSHEIRTPLNAIIGMSQVLSAGTLSPSQQEQIETIRDAGESLLELLTGVLEISKIEAGITKLDIQDVDVGALLEKLKRLWSSRAEAKGLRLELQHNLSQADILRTDPSRLRQILNNIIGNAIKFTNVGCVEVSAERLPRDDGSTALSISVRDTGPGMTQDLCLRIFDRFFQADNSATRKHGGGGLGLSIAKDLAELLGAEIGVQSTFGKGSIFRLTIVESPE